MRVYNGDIIAMWYYQCINTIYLYKCVFYGDSNYSTCLGYIYIYIILMSHLLYTHIYILSMKLNKQGNVLSSLNNIYIYIIVPLIKYKHYY